jgi:hypothetical protein
MTLIKPHPDFWKEKRIPLANLGVDRHYQTLKSWAEDGVQSKITDEVVQLEACYEGSILCTTREAYERFLKKLNGFKPGEK